MYIIQLEISLVGKSACNLRTSFFYKKKDTVIINYFVDKMIRKLIEHMETNKNKI